MSSATGDSNRFARDSTTDQPGADAAAEAARAREAKRSLRRLSGVCEARPGIIEDTHIDPLSESSNDDDGWANVTSTPGQTTAPETVKAASSTLESSADVATGAAKMAYGKVTGRPIQVEEGAEAVFGKNT